MMKNLFVLVCIAVLAISCAQEKQAPNVLFILADDLGAHDLSYAGSSYYESPNIDQLASQAMVFEQGYAAAQVCSPSRASILTGQTTPVHGITDWIGALAGEQWGEKHPYTRILPPDYAHALDTAALTLPELFQRNGYTTFFAGKWHLGSKGSWPEDHGFEINKGGWDYGNPRGGYFSPYKNPNLEDGPDGENLSERLAEETAAFIRSKKDEPFFAMLSFYAVHGPIQTTQEYWQKYRDKALAQGLDSSGFEMERRLPIRTIQDNAIYAGLIQHMDDAVGIVMEELKRQGLLENTIVVFTSDNGGVASGDAYSTSNAPLRGGKGYHWEGGIRVPYLIKAPGAKPGKTSVPASGQDFYPTIAALAGLTIPEEVVLNGENLEPVLKEQSIADRPLVWHYPHYGNQGGDPVSMMRKGQYKLIYYWETDEVELYDLHADVDEQRDIAKEQRDLASQMKNDLLLYLNLHDARFPVENPHFSEDELTAYNKRVREKLLPALERNRLKILKDDFQPNKNWWGSATKD
ncbi:sulfatase [Marinoscillum furvescens]|uniref:Arylsulfatase A-like enzyme n=1 Tax=Marinoscillum furvescens DSM 4134 TaxID=1122208 RepID=A0A3D9L801_MARFU|nr:sulfatase [Marinoscillum furvescens]REE02212.1 arylsulfatase A-like enzyme [Marinoscillum furvescens DSM 4134]